MSYLTQMLGLTVQNFVSAATGMAVLVALIRGFSRKTTSTLGQLLGRSRARRRSTSCSRSRSSSRSSWSRRASCRRFESVRVGDAARGDRRTPTARRSPIRCIALGPAASQVVIKQLGTNGGGFFNVNSAHPFENPTPLSNFVEMFSILLIPAALCYTFGKMVKDTRQGWAVLAAMFVDLPAAALALRLAGAGRQPGARVARRVDQVASALQAGGNMEGKEVRFGIATRRSGRRRRRPPRTARSTRCTTRSRRSAGSCRCGSCSSARSSSAASAPASTACSCSPSSPCSSRGSWSGARRSTSARRSRPTR